jgi:hypothetical protein
MIILKFKFFNPVGKNSSFGSGSKSEVEEKRILILTCDFGSKEIRIHNTAIYSHTKILYRYMVPQIFRLQEDVPTV